MSENNAIPNSLTALHHQVLARTSAADFDGHTGFASLTPAKRLAWLDAAVEFFAQHALRPKVSRPQDLLDIEELQRTP